MTLVLISFLVFIATASIALAGFYFLIEEPSERRRMRRRLEAIEESSRTVDDSEENRVLRETVLSRIPKLNAMMLDVPFLVRFDITLRQGDVPLTVARFCAIVVGLGTLGFVAGAVARFPVSLSVILASLVAAVPFVVVSFRKHRRMSRFAGQFPDAIDLLARAVRAGHAFTTCLELISQELADPVADEFRTVYEQQNLGLSLKDALANLVVRVPLPDVRIFVTALQVQRESGGNLAEILDNLAAVIRERFKLFRQVRVITAEGRLSLYALTALPFVAALLFAVVNPGYLAPLIEDPLGHRLIAGALVSQFIGYLVISRIVRIKV
jgi:tight adherence protein B